MARFPMRSKYLLAAALSVGALSLTACSADPVPPAPDALSANGLNGLDGRALIERLDTMPVADRPDGLIASVRPDAVLVSDDEGPETAVPLPVDEFYLSIAPYVGTTHECYFHSLTTCLGELRDEPVRVLATNRADGAVLADSTTRTYDNGFVGLWLPRDIEADVVVEYAGRTGRTTVGTGPDDPTCITTVDLV
ncbi:CueP family metal-binding protein [Rhodococcus gannanensis]|uniref:CueP family metal-binding protein n=1 Tax=Rhodococcus gannanensis TaxID=1960308 RepID=A0ABW4P4V8_9NOCA